MKEEVFAIHSVISFERTGTSRAMRSLGRHAKELRVVQFAVCFCFLEEPELEQCWELRPLKFL